MVSWPLYADQRFNRVVLVEEIKIALPMNESLDRFVNAVEVETRFRELMDSEEGESIRMRAKALKSEAKAALSEGGTYRVALTKLVESWHQRLSRVYPTRSVRLNCTAYLLRLEVSTSSSPNGR
ncbi:hypothetical protein ACLB2K_070456 [Fragaria x ananassa]